MSDLALARRSKASLGCAVALACGVIVALEGSARAQDCMAWTRRLASPPTMPQGPGQVPRRRYGHAMLDMPINPRGVTLLGGWTTWFGDEFGSTFSTIDENSPCGPWRWDGNAWTPDCGPFGGGVVRRAYFGAALDSNRLQVVTFGGLLFQQTDRGDYFGDLLDVRSRSLAPNAHSASTNVWGQAAAYDARRGRVVLFGGISGLPLNQALSNETWEWNGTFWTRVQPPHSPSARAFHGMVYDTATQSVLMLGGSDGAYESPEVWAYDGNDWRLRNSHPAPPAVARSAAAVTYDTLRNRVVVFGGSRGGQLLGDTWYYTSAGGWTTSDAPGPTPREHAAMAYDAARDRVVLFGGRGPIAGQAGLVIHGDTWELAPNSAFTVSQPPQSQTLLVGRPLQLTVSVNQPDVFPTNVRWVRNGEVIPGAVGPILQIAVTTLADTGTYFARVSDGCTTIDAGPAAVTVLPFCLTDYNQSGTVDPDDLSDFIGAYFGGGCP